MTTDSATKPYQPHGAAETLFYCKDPEIVLSGPAGTGKSRACLEKLNLCAIKYPKMRGLILRKTRESLTQTAMVTYESNVLPDGWLGNRIKFRTQEQEYRYWNGSKIAVGGLDKPTKIMSAEYDIIYIQEAIETTQNDWEMATTRLRNGVMPYQQIIADTNPDTPTHWIEQRRKEGGITMLESRHEDNPRLFDKALGQWTAEGATYIGLLDRLTGPRKDRLRYGRWVGAEGVVFEGWDRSVHLIDRFEIPVSWPRYWVVDFGFTNPFCWQAWAKDPDGRLYRYKEIYMTQRTVKDHAELIKEVTKDEPRPQAIICDHDAEDRETLKQCLGLNNIAAYKAVSRGIQLVQERLKLAGDGKPRIFFLRDSLVQRDRKRDELKQPCCAEEEVDGYIWNTSSGRGKGEEPVKENDHAMDTTRYLVAHFDKEVKKTFAPAVGGQRPNLTPNRGAIGSGKIR